jgi:hypothetical protein
MLPDFPETKKLFNRFFRTYMRRKMREISPYGAVQTRHYHEGRGMKVTRADQTESTSSMERLSVVFEIKHDEIENLTLQKAIAKYGAMIEEMVRKQTNFIREQMSSEIPESQTLSMKGRKFDAQAVLDVLAKMQIEFYPDGTPHEIFLDPPPPPETMAAVDKEFESNPELKTKFDKMMEKKKEEWRAREADRKLVG